MSAIPADASRFMQTGMAGSWGLCSCISLRAIYNKYVNGAEQTRNLTDVRRRYPVLAFISSVAHTLEWTLLAYPILVPIAHGLTLGMYVHGYLDTTDRRLEESEYEDLTYLASFSNICMIAYSVLKIGAYFTGSPVPMIGWGIPYVFSYVGSHLYSEFETLFQRVRPEPSASS
ncbi:MAG: hypothetical protein SP1CHLAM54_16580 [Chlamydiia bacterium]|nr:hypothetical protein [Chlamydiia bacterium]MCH9616547.1 hypothetical protein [Chlamydiia bacterium]MCH9629277.1 hypothetical protein [Chlamydiia bacterium]